MLINICPKLPMRDRNVTIDYYVNHLGFKYIGSDDFNEYLIVEKDTFQLHFFLFKDLNPTENYGQVYIRTTDIEILYNYFLDHNISIHPNGSLTVKPWNQKEFSLLDPDNNLITFGQSLEG